MRKKFHQKHLLLGLTAGLDSWDCPFQLFTENKSKLLMHGFEPQISGLAKDHSPIELTGRAISIQSKYSSNARVPILSNCAISWQFRKNVAVLS